MQLKDVKKFIVEKTEVNYNGDICYIKKCILRLNAQKEWVYDVELYSKKSNSITVVPIEKI